MIEPTTAPAVSTRRDAILKAALAEFTEHGVAGGSIERIRRRAHASVGSIYHHFGDKDGLAGALFLEGLTAYQDGFLAVLHRSGSIREGIEAGVHHHLAWIGEHPDLARFLLLGRDARLVVATQRPLREQNRRFFGAVTAWIAPAVDAGELRDCSPELLTALWIGPSQELARYWLAGRSRTSLLDAAPILAQAAWSSLTTEVDNHDPDLRAAGRRRAPGRTPPAGERRARRRARDGDPR